MARIPLVGREQLSPQNVAVFDAIAQNRGHVPVPFYALLHAPAVASHVSRLGEEVRFHSALPGDLTELAILTTARTANCQYQWTHHVPLARKAGVREAAIEAIRDRRPLTALLPREAAVARFARELLDERQVSDVTFAEAHALLGTQGVVFLTALVGYYNLLAFCINGFELELEPGVQPLLPG